MLDNKMTGFKGGTICLESDQEFWMHSGVIELDGYLLAQEAESMHY